MAIIKPLSTAKSLRSLTAPTKIESLSSKNDKFLSGGTFSDILDIAQAPQYAVTGLLSGKGAMAGIRTRTTPSKALDLGPISGLIADIILDPLNLVGVGSLTKAGKAAGKLTKTGELIEKATTLGGKVAKGENTLLSIAGQRIIPRAAEEKIAAGITKGVEAIKSSPVGKLLEKFGVSPATGGKTLEAIEEGATKFKLAKQAGLRSKGSIAKSTDEALKVATRLDNELRALIKTKKVVNDEVPNLLKAIRDKASGLTPSVKLPTALSKMADELGSIITEQQALRKALDLPSIEGKMLPLIPATESKEYLKSVKKPSVLSREYGSTSGSELAGSHFKLGDAIVKQEGKIASEILPKGKSGKKFIEIGDSFYDITKLDKDKSQGVNKLISDVLRASGGKPLTRDDIIRIAKQETRLSDVGSFDELQKIIRNGAKKVGVEEDVLNKALTKAGSELRFSEDPIELVGELMARTGKSKAKKQFVSDVSAIGIPKPKGALPEGFRESSLPELKGLIFPEPVVKHIDKTSGAFSKVDDVNDFVKMYDKIQNTWKGLATFVNPAFHSRNFVSNLWQGYLGDVKNPLWYTRSGRIQKAVNLANRTGRKLDDIIGVKDAKLWEEFANEGVSNTGWFGADIENALAKQQNAVFKLGGNVGGFIEDNAKLAMFLERKAKGLSSAEAAADVRKYFFDYGDLTDFEKNVMKRVFPFYTWTRKNIPLQAAMLIQSPTKFTSINKIKDAIEKSRDGKPLDDKLVPQWLKDGYPIFFGKNKNNQLRYLRLEGFLPAVDLDNIGSPLDSALTMTSPLIKAPFELASNRNFFFDREIKEFPGQTKEVLGFNVPATSAYFAQQIRPIMELDRLFDEGLTLPERLVKLMAGFKMQNFDRRKQKSTFDYLKSLQEGKINAEISRKKRENNRDAIPGLRKNLRDTQRDFSL